MVIIFAVWFILFIITVGAFDLWHHHFERRLPQWLPVALRELRLLQEPRRAF